MILIVDDDNAVRMSIALALTKNGYKCESVSSEKEALTAIRRDETELVILDMNLTLSTTGRQGVELLHKFRVLRPEIPVIMITAWGTIPLAVESLNLGACDFITKPWSNLDLVKKVKDALKTKEKLQGEREHIDTLDEIERKSIVKAIRQCDGNLSLAAEKLGITRQSLYRRIEKYGI